MAVESPVTRLLSRLEGVKEGGTGWTAKCPAHDDSHASLSISEGLNGGAVTYCHAGCTYEQIVAAVGLTVADLFPPRAEQRNGHHAPSAAQPKRRWEILDIQGVVQAIHVRKDGTGGPKEKSFSWYLPSYPPDDPKPWGLKKRATNTLPLYGAELLADLEPGSLVIVVEGEKTADALRSRGFTALGTTTGAGNPIPTDDVLAVLHPFKVALWADADDVGHAHMQAIAQRLVAHQQHPLEICWKEATEKDDAADFVDRGGTAAQLQAMVDAAFGWSSGLSAEEIRAAAPETTPENVWTTPAPFRQIDLPPFPLDVLPRWLRDFVEAESIATQTTPHLAGNTCLAVVSAATLKKVSVEIRQGWIEPINIYSLTVARPGERKSAIARDCAAPIENWEAAQLARVEPEIAQAENELKILQKELLRAQEQASKAKTEEKDAYRVLANEVAHQVREFKIPTRPRLLVEDSSPEKIASLLHEQGGRLAIVSPEGGDIFDIASGRYSSNSAPNMGVFLRSYSGDSLRIDRINRPSELVHQPLLTQGLLVQPEVLTGLFERQSFLGKGFCGRFLYCISESLLGRRQVDAPPVPSLVTDTYRHQILALLNLPDQRNEQDELVPRAMVMSAEARQVMEAFMGEIEPRLAEDGDLGQMTDWGTRIAGNVARLAGILHVATCVEYALPWLVPIGEETARSAVALGHYYIAHAQAAYSSMGADADVDAAKTLLSTIQRKQLAHFTKKELHGLKQGDSRFKKADALDAPLELLEDHGYLREHPAEERTGPGRKPSPIYDVNPEWLAAPSPEDDDTREEVAF